MSINTSKVIDRLDFYAPEHSSKAQSLKETAVTAAVSQRINQSLWAEAGALTDGAAYLAAHLLTIRDRYQQQPSSSSGVGPIRAIREGELEIDWDTNANASARKDLDMSLASTPYGQAFIDLRKTIPATPFMSED